MLSSERLPKLVPSSLDDAQRQVYDAITSGPRVTGPQRSQIIDDEGCLVGPFNSMLLSPPVGMALQTLGSALRFDSCLTDRQRELAILMVASHWGSTFEWETHEAIGRAAGVTNEELRSIASQSPIRIREPTEQATVDWVRRILASLTTDDNSYREAIAAMGQRALYELTTLVGYYSILALHLRIFAREDDAGLQEQQRRQPPNGRPSAP